MDGGAWGELLFYILIYGFLFFTFIGVLRWFILRNDGRKHLNTKILTSICIFITIFGFIANYNSKKNRLQELSGSYEVQNFKCQKCLDCKVILKTNGTYMLLQSTKLIDSGKWDYKDIDFDAAFLRTDFIFDGVTSYGREIDSKRIISYIKNSDCSKRKMIQE